MLCFTLQCLPLPLQTPTQRYLRGAYKCECRQGYEYPFNDLSWFFDGQMMEEEYNKMLRGEPNRCAFCYHNFHRQDCNSSFSHWFYDVLKACFDGCYCLRAHRKFCFIMCIDRFYSPSCKT